MIRTAAILFLGLCFALVPAAIAKEHKMKTPSPNAIDWKDVPAKAQEVIKNNSNGGKVVTVQKQMKNNVAIYNAEVKQHDGTMLKVSVAEDGRLIQAKPEKQKHKHHPLFGEFSSAPSLTA